MNNQEASTPVASVTLAASPVATPTIAPIYPPSTSTDWSRKPLSKPIISREKQTESTKPVIHYPESDDMPMTENTEQYTKLTTIKGNIEYLFKPDPNVFIAGDLFWYPVEGHNDIVYAPDVLVAFGRPKGKRGSYKQWEEGNIPPQIVFEIWSPNNSNASKKKKFAFYQKYGVEEYYTYDPDNGELKGWLRKDGQLKKIPEMIGWRSPLLNVKFTIEETPDGPKMQLYHPDGTRFVSHEEDLEMRRQETAARVEAEEKAQEEATARAEAEAKAQEEVAARAAAEAEAERTQALLRAALEQLQKAGLSLPDSSGS